MDAFLTLICIFECCRPLFVALKKNYTSYVARMFLTFICLASSVFISRMLFQTLIYYFYGCTSLCWVLEKITPYPLSAPSQQFNSMVCINVQLLLQTLFCFTFCNLRKVIPCDVNSIKIWVCRKNWQSYCFLPWKWVSPFFAVIPILAIKVVFVNKILSCKLL